MARSSAAQLLLLLAGAACCTGLSFDKAGNGLEPATSTVFPMRMGGAELTGMGARVKKIVFVSVQVYSVGLYLDKADSKQALGAFTNEPGFAADGGLYEALLQDNIGKTLRLLMVRTVSGDQMGNALSDALQSRLGAGSEDAFARFKKLFSMPELKAGTEILFRWAPGGTLTTTVNGEEVGSIDSLPLCMALYDIYLGEASVVDGGRHALVERLPEFLASASV